MAYKKLYLKNIFQIRQKIPINTSTNTNIQFQLWSNTNTKNHVFEYKYLFDLNPVCEFLRRSFCVKSKYATIPAAMLCRTLYPDNRDPQIEVD